jgi:hypothetical protein
MYQLAGELHYLIVIKIVGYIPDVCNTLFLFQFVNLVFIVKQSYSHSNKRFNSWIIVTMSRQIILMEEDER